MKNPWIKKTPLMSMWLSAANAAAGAARGQATAHAKRHASTLKTHGVNQMTRWWTDALRPPSPRKGKKRR